MCSLGGYEGGLMNLFLIIGFWDVISNIVSPYIIFILFLVAVYFRADLGYFRRFTSCVGMGRGG